MNRIKLTEILEKYFDIGDSYSYNLTRTKEGFKYDTVSLEDFEEFDEDVIQDMVEFIINELKEEQ